MTLAEVGVSRAPASIDNVLLDHVHAGVCVIRDTRFMYVNRCLAGMLGHDVAHMLADMEPISIVHPDDFLTSPQRSLREGWPSNLLTPRSYLHRCSCTNWRSN